MTPEKPIIFMMLLFCWSCGVADPGVEDLNLKEVDYMPLGVDKNWVYTYSARRDFFNSPEETDGILNWRHERTVSTSKKEIYTLIETFDGQTRRGYYDGAANWEFKWEPLKPLKWERILEIEEEEDKLRFVYSDQVLIEPDSIWGQGGTEPNGYARTHLLNLTYLPQPVSRYVVNGRDSVGETTVFKGENAWFFVRKKGLVHYEWVNSGARAYESQKLFLRE